MVMTMMNATDTSAPLILGAVAYDPKVVTIWDGFLQYFQSRGLAFDYVLYSNYERQVEAQMLGHVHVAWNSPLAWLQAEQVAARTGRRAEAICMRDTDRDLRSLIVVSSEGGIAGIEDLRGKVVAVGARDSPQATLIPLHHLAAAGLAPGRDFEVKVFDALAGKHGDHIGGERDAVRALLRGEADAACLIDSNHLAFAREGTIPASATRVLAQTAAYDHCNFTVLDGVRPEQVARFRDLLLNMSYADAEVRPLLDLEGLKQWLPGRVSGYGELAAAVGRFGTIEAFVSRLQAACA
jgi:ABC-type phosphate/phosphonate transport system substrate-binding protein